ncbi:MAG: hypothetical protein L0Y77_06710 [Chlorobi bacterium]|nr:hypothetical protein [Chlorobiota bacterium]
MKKRKRKLKIRVFKSHAEQEKADIRFWRSKTPSEKMKLYEEFFYNYLMLQHGKIPRLQRVINVIKRKKR